MEFLLWLWVCDKRLLCCIDHGTCLLVYIWLLPLMISLGFLVPSLYEVLDVPDSIQEEEVMISNCVGLDTTELETFVKLQLVCLGSICLLHIAIFIKAIAEFKSQNVPEHLYGHKACHYDYWPRKRVIRSYQGYCLLILSVINIISASIYLGRYRQFEDAVARADSDCFVPGADILWFYSLLAVIPFGILGVSLYVVSFCIKVSALLNFLLCPVWIIRCKKRSRGIPENFDHLYDELHSDGE